MSNIELLDSLKQQIIDELNCPLKDAATNIVFGKGNPDADIVFIGEAPGEQEDLQGIPFVGRAGKELDKLLNQIGLTLDDVYICNILKYRPPKNRDPSVDEIKSHTPYLIDQLKIIKPKIIATLGNYSTKFVLGGFSPDNMKTVNGISVLHGTKHDVSLDGISITVVPIYHPAAMLYNPRLRESFTQDFLVMANILGLTPKNSPQNALSNFM
ncbi:uracil-DNA glycosylase [Candidatus Woesearchaeota archaeon]|nr:uracil-DNA glycosylase [Candidatus Woesearchaeota archaeon]